LFSAGRLDDLVQLVLDEPSPAVIPDGFRRAEVQGRRLDLAARAAATTDNASTAVRLAISAADAASRLDTLSSLVESHLDLVARLRTWQPEDFALDAVAGLAARVAPELGPQRVRETLRICGVPPLEQAPFLAYAVTPDAPPARDWVDESVAAALRIEPGEVGR